MATIVKCNNGTVTDSYLEAIGEALSKIGEKVVFTKNVKNINSSSRQEIVVVARLMDYLSVRIRGFKNIVMWFQGVEPEESYMSHQSKTRKCILEFIEKRALKKSIFCYFVSQAMQEHYARKYRIAFAPEKVFCMPCLNTGIHESTFHRDQKYRKNIFVYVGSLAPWQKFEETLDIYQNIITYGIQDIELRIYTPDQEKARAIVKDRGIENATIGFVDNEHIPEVLSDVKFGFVIRDDNVVNNVATPTKLSTYLSCGVIPIYSRSLYDFYSIARNMRYAICFDNEFKNKLLKLSKEQILNEEVYKEYKNVFDTYYNRDKYIDLAAQKMKKILR